MDYTLVSHNMEALGQLLEIVCAIVGVTLAISAGALLAWHLSPFDPSEAESSKSHERYVNFQARWANNRIKRLAMANARASSDIETRRTARLSSESDQTVPDMRLSEMFSGETVEVHPSFHTRSGFAS